MARRPASSFPSSPSLPRWPAAADLLVAGAEPAAEGAWRAAVEKARREPRLESAGIAALGKLAEARLARLGPDALVPWLRNGWLPAATALPLADLVLQALAEAQSPALEGLQRHLASGGHVAATLQQAQAALEAGEFRRTLALCQRVARSPEAQALAAEARKVEDVAAEAALQTATSLVDAGLTVAAQTLLQVESELWQHHPRYVALRARIREAEVQTAADQELDAARAALLAAYRGDPEAQPEALAALARWSDATPVTPGESSPPAGWALPAPGAPQLQAWWPALSLARSAGITVVPRALALPALRALLDRGHAAPDAAGLLARLPAAWRELAAMRAVAAALAAAEAASWEAALAVAEATVGDALDRDDVPSAQSAVDALAAARPQRAKALEPLRREIAQAKQRLQRRDHLRTVFGVQLEQADWFAARRSLSELRHLERAADHEPRVTAWQDAVGDALYGQPVDSSEGLARRDQPLRLAKAGSQALIVQGRLWIEVQLDGETLRPWRLPAALALEPATTKLAVLDGRWIAAGIGGGQLLRIEQAVDEWPLVTAGVGLGEVLQGDSQIVGLLTPVASESTARWGIVSRAGERAPVSWTSLDPEELTPLGRSRCKPDWWAVAGDAQGRCWAVPVPAARAGFALAQLGADGSVSHTWRADDVGESIAALTEVLPWPAGERTFARFASFDPYDGRVSAQPSLLVLRGDRITFASSELKRRFLPMSPEQLGEAWALDADAGVLWFALQGAGQSGGGLLAVDARTLRPQQPLLLGPGLQVLSLAASEGDVLALAGSADGGLWLIRATAQDGAPRELTRFGLPL